MATLKPSSLTIAIKCHKSGYTKGTCGWLCEWIMNQEFTILTEREHTYVCVKPKNSNCCQVAFLRLKEFDDDRQFVNGNRFQVQTDDNLFRCELTPTAMTKWQELLDVFEKILLSIKEEDDAVKFTLVPEIV